MTYLHQHQRNIADATAAYTEASDAPTIQARINDTISEWATRNRTAGRWISDSDIAAEQSKMATRANAELQAAAERVQEEIALGTLACEQMEREAEQIVPYWQRDTTRLAGDYVAALVRLSWTTPRHSRRVASGT